jgi:multiple sugar transport system permease protein
MQLLRHSRLTLAQKEELWALFFIAPWLIGFVVFTAGPMLFSFFFSLTRYNIVDAPIFIGFENYMQAFGRDPLFWHSLRVTIYYGALSLPLGLLVGFGLSLLLNQKVPLLSLWRTIYFLPSVIAGVAVAIVWSRIFSPQGGLLNPFLERTLGIQGPGWFTDPGWAIPGLVIMSLWGVGGGVIIYLAGLQGIPTSLYDAARVDGANALQRFRYVTLPMMTPVLFYMLVLGLIGTFQYFTEVYVISGGSGGPQRATLFYNLYLYQNAFKFNEMGYASALAWVLFLIVLALTLLVFRSSALWVYYEGEIRKR